MQSLPCRVTALLLGLLAFDALHSAEPEAKHSGKIVKIEAMGELLREPNLPGERRADDVVPGQTSGLRLSKDRWLVLCNTRSFRGIDDERSVVYQVRKDAPDGHVIKEGFLAQSIDDWDPLKEGKPRVKQHGHVVSFGVPKGALIDGKPAGHANHFVALWRVVAVAYDPEKKAVPRTPPALRQQTQGVEWVQFRLNEAESDLEIVQPLARLRQAGFETGPKFGSLDVAHMNQSFVPPVPANPACTEWLLCNHFDGGRIAVLQMTFDPEKKRYRWTRSGPLAGGPESLLSEASLAKVGDDWVVAARTGGKTRGVAWTKSKNPLESLPEPKVVRPPVTDSPITAFVAADGVLRVFTGDVEASPRHRGRDPMYMWQVDPTDFAAAQRETIFDTVEAKLGFRHSAWPKIDFAKLFPPHGKTQLISYRVNVRSNNFGYDGVRKDIPVILPEEKARCGIYYSRITYADVVPEPWTFAGP